MGHQRRKDFPRRREDLNHAKSFAVVCIDRNYLLGRRHKQFVTTYTEDEEILQEFDALPYGKKVCFVPFKSDLDSAWYIDLEIDNVAKEKYGQNMRARLDRFGWGYVFYYDLFDMLLYGKKTQLIDM